MNDKLDIIFNQIKSRVFELIQVKNIDIDALAFDLEVNREKFMEYFENRSDYMGFYFQALHLVENWEG